MKGGQRTIFSAGVLDTFLEANFNPFSLLIGVSAGSLNLASYVCEDQGHAYNMITKVSRHPEFFDLNKYLLKKVGMDLDYLIEQTENRFPLSWGRGREQLKSKTFLATASHAETLETKFFDINHVRWQDALKATSAIPLVSNQQVMIDNHPWVDGGVSSAIPAEEAYRQGYKHIVVIRSIHEDDTSSHDWVRFLTKFNLLGKKIPKLAEMLMTHENNYINSQQFLKNPPEDVNIYEIYPRRKLRSHVLSSSKKDLHSDYLLGKRMGQFFLSTVAKKLHLTNSNLNVKNNLLPLITNEQSLISNIKDHINFLWQTAEKGEFIGVDKVKVRWLRINPQNKKDTIVIVNGRNESFWKYQELILELSEHYNIYTYDHRGQGESDRFTTNPELGHVDDFADYVMDLYIFMEKVVYPNIDGKCYLLGHSMGGVVTTKYVTLFENSIDAMILSAPMFGVVIPKAASVIKKPALNIFEYFTKKPNYALGAIQYKHAPFEKNVLTQSKIRYKLFKELYKNNSHLKLEGPSARWVSESIKAGKQCIQNAEKVDTPTLILQATNDSVVDNKAQDKFNEQCQTSQIMEIEDAFHDILIDKDQCRNKALNEIFHFFNQYDKE
ncbi:alpha/beta fold hydrolase [Vibrio sp. SS-MA-C1-2]|uniref:alpha/beta fold hydrolase n=1 Tax=Vibrio sp. SS-MA-C1-2 TaxID=2908646 RepID=UPI001F4593A4|nr:alpha/beta fold hydrolase [Vibrio sp. SS-MA-C1-2]UJF18371.1 alpha/beta fold hydrolase [Vibrio sp. SS-MA-C1-2]